MRIILANPRGFCAGVNMAIESLERALELFGWRRYLDASDALYRRLVDGAAAAPPA